MAVISLVLGITSLPTYLLCSVVGLPLSLGAVVLGVLSLHKISKQPMLYGGKGMAIAGIALGSLSLVLVVVMVGVLIFAAAAP